MTEEQKEAIEHFQGKEIEFTIDGDMKEMLKALGINPAEDTFPKNAVRINSLLQLIQEQKIRIEYLERSCDRKESTIIELEFENNCISTSRIKDKIIYYENLIEKLYSKKVWNEPVDTILKNRYVNYINVLNELLEERAKRNEKEI